MEDFFANIKNTIYNYEVLKIKFEQIERQNEMLKQENTDLKRKLSE